MSPPATNRLSAEIGSEDAEVRCEASGMKHRERPVRKQFPQTVLTFWILLRQGKSIRENINSWQTSNIDESIKQKYQEKKPITEFIIIEN